MSEEHAAIVDRDRVIAELRQRVVQLENRRSDEIQRQVARFELEWEIPPQPEPTARFCRHADAVLTELARYRAPAERPIDVLQRVVREGASAPAERRSRVPSAARPRGALRRDGDVGARD